MSAIPRKERRSLKLPIERLKKLRFSRGVFFTILLILIGLPLCLLVVSAKPGDVRFEYVTIKGCIDEEKVRSTVKQQRIIQLISFYSALLKNEYTCLQKVSVVYRPVATITITVETKAAVFGVQAYQVDVNDGTDWKSVFARPRTEGELYFVSKDGSATYFDQGASVPRITLLKEDQRSVLEPVSIEQLMKLYSLLEEKDKSVPKVEVYSNAVVKISTVNFEELYLPLDETMEVQLRKAYAVASFLSLRGTSVRSIDARMRDVVVSTR